MASLEYTAQSPYNVTPAPSQPEMPQVGNNDFLQTIPFGLRSNTWRTQDAETAKSLAKNGVDAISIYKQTGTWLSSDGKWRQEVAKGGQFPQGAGKAGIYKLPADYNIKSTALDNITEAAKAQYAKGALSALLNNPKQSLGDAVKDVKNLFNPEYMKNVKGMSNEEAINLALDANPVMGAITAFHGSPYRFDKFDATKIGSGEGAQAFGHGLYFAESPEVAKSYQDVLGIQKTSMSQMANDNLSNYNIAPSNIKHLHQVATDKTIPIENAAKVIKNANAALRNAPDEVLSNLVSNFREQSKGNLYKVDIPDEAIPKMLDWDKRISEQPKNVQDLWNRFIKKNPEYSDPELVGSQYLNPTGEQIHNALFEKTQGMGVDARSKVAKQLKNSGITGIRYLDRDSRGHQVDLTYKGNPYPTEANKFSDIRQAQQYADEMIAKGYGANIKQTGTSNYVVFDDKLPKILERN